MSYMRQATAKDLAQRVTKLPCKLKEVRHRRCIFVGSESSTNFYGLTWDEALEKLFIAYCVPDSVRQTFSIGSSAQIGSDPSKTAVGLPDAVQGVSPALPSQVPSV